MKFNQSALAYSSRLLRFAIYLTGQKRGNILAAHLTESLVPVVRKTTPAGALKFFCAGTTSEWRARTILTKEPETLEWIDSFEPGDVLWDIGANVGVYSLYAALRGIQVLAFEPSAPNYYLLNRNIEMNQFGPRISAYCLAFSDQRELGQLHMASTELGGALNSFGESLDWQGRTFQPSFSQAMVGYTVDSFIEAYGPHFPTHIKIDVDGIENRIVRGAVKTLADSRLKSLLVELDSSREGYCDSVFEFVERAGMKFVGKRHAPEMDGTPYASSFNYFFQRDLGQAGVLT
jgi:FkbM family methyltransferase